MEAIMRVTLNFMDIKGNLCTFIEEYNFYCSGIAKLSSYNENLELNGEFDTNNGYVFAKVDLIKNFGQEERLISLTVEKNGKTKTTLFTENGRISE